MRGVYTFLARPYQGGCKQTPLNKKTQSDVSEKLGLGSFNN